MNLKEEERRARLLKMRAERLPDIKKQFEEAQKRNFNSNFAPGGKDEALAKNKTGAKVKKPTRAAHGGSATATGKNPVKATKTATAKTARWSTISACFLRMLMRRLLSILLASQ